MGIAQVIEKKGTCARQVGTQSNAMECVPAAGGKRREIHRDLEKGSGEGGAAKSCGMVARISYVVKTKGRYGMATEDFRASE